MKTLKLTCFIILLSLAGLAQTTKYVVANPNVKATKTFLKFEADPERKRILVADETELVTLKSSFKIETSNEKIFSLIRSDLKDLVTKYTVSIKKDRSGTYQHYSVPFKQADFEKVREFLKKLD